MNSRYRPWKALGMTEVAYWKRQYLEARKELPDEALHDAEREVLAAADAWLNAMHWGDRIELRLMRAVQNKQAAEETLRGMDRGE